MKRGVRRMEVWDPARRTEERIDEIRYRLAVDEAAGGKAGGALAAWEVEEELLDELAGLESCSTGGDDPETSRALLPARWRRSR